MKRLLFVFSCLAFMSLACSLLPTALPVASPTFVTHDLPSSTPRLSDEPATSQAIVEEAATGLPTVTFAAPTALPQPAVARHQPGDPLVLDQITMIDISNGWAIRGADVLFTVDGAQTWREATPPETLPAGSQVEAWGAFLDAEHAWIIFSVDHQIPANAAVWRTEDSGYTWTASTSLEHEVFGEQVWAEFFALDQTHLWLMVRGVYLGAGTHSVGQLLRSTDGGLTWLPLVGNGNFDYNYDYTGMVFADRDHGLVTWQTTSAYAPGPPEYAVTSNDAASWDVHQLPPPTDTPDLFVTSDYCEPFQPQMLSSQSIRLLVGCFDVYDPPQVFSSYLYSSEDGGATWTSVQLPEKVVANQVTLSFFDKDNALLLGREIYRSKDSGQGWEHVKAVTWAGQFSFVDPQTGWAIARANGETALVKTSNGGAAWIELKPVVAP